MERRSAAADFWNNHEAARGQMRRISELRDTIEVWRTLEQDTGHLIELLDLAEGEGDRGMQDEIARDASAVLARLGRLEFDLALSGHYDDRNALVSIHAGAGGTESQDWAQMLLRMYLRWAERRGFDATILDISHGEEAGVKSVQIELKGKYAYGYAKSEKGSHRLVRLSPFDADHARHTSFALVEVMPEADPVEVTIDPDDLRLDYFRASGKGGQNVQKNSTAVRVVHEPTGTTVSVQNERSQRQNREAAMTILASRLMRLEVEKQAKEHARIKGEYVPAEWGNKIRSYVLHPYKLVKDHRTEHESTDPDSVLDGDLEAFLSAYVTYKAGESGG